MYNSTTPLLLAASLAAASHSLMDVAIIWVAANVSATVTSHVRQLCSFLGMRVRPSERISLFHIRLFGSLQNRMEARYSIPRPNHSAVDGRLGMAVSAEFASETMSVINCIYVYIYIFIPFLEVVVAKAGDRLVLSGDFNCPGDSSAPDPELTSILDSFDLTLHVNKPTRKHNLLDILITPSTSDVLSNVRVHQSDSMSDHQLVTCQLGIEPKKLEERTFLFLFRDIKKIDIEAF